MFDRVQILPNTLKHVEACLNSTKQGGQAEKFFANQKCFSMFYRKTLKHVETCLNSTKQGGQAEKFFANQKCFSMF